MAMSMSSSMPPQTYLDLADLLADLLDLWLIYG